MPDSLGNYLLLLLMCIAAVAVIVGVIAMAVNGQFNKKYSNSLMQMRVLFQGLALLLLALIVWLSS